MSAQLVLLLTSPRVAPGLLSRAGWQAIEAADAVLCADRADALPGAVVESGLDVAELPVAAGGPAQQARTLVERALEGSVVWLGSPDGDPGLTDALASELSKVGMSQQPPTVEVLVASHDVPGARLLDLVAVMDRLRSPGGCPWDAEQTHESLVPYLIEEAYEAAEALEAGEPGAVREELGDVLLQVVFHARMAQDATDQPFDVDDVAAAIVAKLVRRHPHVFAVEGVSVGADGPEPAAGHSAPRTTASDVQANWDLLKAAEKGRASILDGIPLALPALARADKVIGRLERAGVPAEALAETVGDPVADEALALVRRARAAGVEAESALRAGVRELERRQRQREGTP